MIRSLVQRVLQARLRGRQFQYPHTVFRHDPIESLRDGRESIGGGQESSLGVQRVVGSRVGTGMGEDAPPNPR